MLAGLLRKEITRPNAELIAVENKIPKISSLVKKKDYNTKITAIERKLTNYYHDKYIIAPELNTLDADVFNKISTSKFNNKDRLSC